jgi:hypothetical protein
MVFKTTFNNIIVIWIVSKFDEKLKKINNFPFLDLFMSKTVIIIWQKNSPLVHVSLCDTGLY